MQSTEWLRRLVTGSPFFGAIERPIAGPHYRALQLWAWDSVIRSDCNHCAFFKSRGHFLNGPTTGPPT